MRPRIAPASSSVPCLPSQLDREAGGPGNGFNKFQHDASKPPYPNTGPGNSNKEGLSFPVFPNHGEEHPEVAARGIFKPSTVAVQD